MNHRHLLPSDQILPSALRHISDFHAATITEVSEAVSHHDVVVVGMAQNPHVKNVRKILTDAGIAFTYLEYGSYFSQWQRRLAIKQWSGWPTFPQVFVRGALLGGEDLTKAALADGSLKELLAKPKRS